MPTGWEPLPYEAWSATRDTLHGHAQVLGKLAGAFAPPEPQFQHVALRLTARGWETLPLPAPDGSGAIGVALDLHAHETVVEHSDGRVERIPLTPHRSVGAVTRDVLAATRRLAGPFDVKLEVQEAAWTGLLDEDEEHATFEPEHVDAYLAVATRAAQILAAFRAPYRGRSTPVNAWWGSFDLAVSLFSGEPAEPPTPDFIMRNSMNVQEVAVGWWPGDDRYPKAAFYAYAYPAPPGYDAAGLESRAARWEPSLGEFVLDWDAVCEADDSFQAAWGFVSSVARHACTVCGWEPALTASVDGDPPPIS